jgi:hypothetical protein
LIVRQRGEIICKTVISDQWSVVREVVRKDSGRAYAECVWWYPGV